MVCRVIIIAVFSLLISCSALAQTMQQWRDSLEVLNRQIAQSPSDLELHLRKAAVNIELGEWEYAADEYTLVLAKDATNPAARFFRAYTNTQLHRYDQALFDYAELLRVSPLHFEARLGHAYVQEKTGRRMEALDELNLMVEMFPDSASAYAARADLENTLHQTELALYDWERAVQTDSLNADYVQSHALLLLSLERGEEARQVLDAAVARGLPRGLFQPLYARIKRMKE